MHVEHPDTEPRGLDGCFRDGIRNVVIFDVQEDPDTRLGQLPDKSRAFGCEQLKTDLECACMGPKFFNSVDRLFGVWNIERDDQFFFDM